jgi:HAD superfamily hydrolase (TIGR01484 family)
MLNQNLVKKIALKKVIIFDLDGTLTLSKANLDKEIGKLLCNLLNFKKVAIIGGGDFKQFKKQFLNHFKCNHKNLKNLFLFPTNSSSFYKFENNRFKKIYELKLKPQEVKKIHNAFKKTFKEFSYKHPKKTYGQIIENRKTQITFSALGQKIVEKLKNRGITLKQKWNLKNNQLRIKMAKFLQKLLPEFEVKLGGLTSIDITKKGIDKAYGIKQISKNLKIPIKEMVFIGDALFYGGNDYEAKKTKILCLPVKNIKETKNLIKTITNLQ